MYVTRRRLSEWRARTSLVEADEPLARHVPALLVALVDAPFNEQIDEADATQMAPLALRLSLTASELYIVLEWARAAGRLVKLS